MLVCLTVVIISLCICISKHHGVHLTYVQLFFFRKSLAKGKETELNFAQTKDRRIFKHWNELVEKLDAIRETGWSMC